MPLKTPMQNRVSSNKRRAAGQNSTDEAVLIFPNFLIDRYKFRKRDANSVAKSAYRICAKRWPGAIVRICEDNNTIGSDAPVFILIQYGSRVPEQDVDMEIWAQNGSYLKKEIHDYLFIRACEEAKVRAPDLTTHEIPISANNLADHLKWEIPDYSWPAKPLSAQPTETVGRLCTAQHLRVTPRW